MPPMRRCALCVVKRFPAAEAVMCPRCNRRSYCSPECAAADADPDGIGTCHGAWCAGRADGMGSSDEEPVGEEEVDWGVRLIDDHRDYGVVALRDLPAGYKLLVERGHVYPVIPPLRWGAYMELVPFSDVDLEGKWRLNEFAVDCGDSELCLRIARMNHACDPNAFTWRDEERGARVVVTGRPIAAGEEITFAYIAWNALTEPSERDADACRWALSTRWGIDCDPATCICYNASLNEAVARGKTLLRDFESRTGGAGTTAAGAATAVAAFVVPSTYPEKLAVAKALRDDHVARFAALRATPKAAWRTLSVAPSMESTTIEFKVIEEVAEVSVSDLLVAWRGPIEVTPVEDIFNDKLDFGVDSWDKLEVLNDGMYVAMSKFKMLYQESPDFIAATTAFVTNYRAIGEALASMEARVAGDAGAAAALAGVLREVTARLTAAAAQFGFTMTDRPAVAPAASAATPAAPAAATDSAVVAASAAAGTCASVADGHLSSSFDMPAMLATLTHPVGATFTPAHMQFLVSHLPAAAGGATPLLELLYQATVDGVMMDDLLRKCKGKGPALVVGREATRGWLFGGYMDCGISDVGSEKLTFHAGTFEPAPKSFVFTLTNPHGVPPTVFRRAPSQAWNAIVGVRRNRAAVSLGWYTALQANPMSVLVWGMDGKGGVAYEPFGPHGSLLFTGSKEWAAAEVVVYRVTTS